MIKGLALAVAVGLGLVMAMGVAANTHVAQPTNIRVLSAYAYFGLADEPTADTSHPNDTSADMLVLVKYRLEYDTIPTQLASEAFAGRFLNSGDRELASTTPSPYPTTNLTNGYGDGLFVFYWDAALRQSQGVTWYDGTIGAGHKVAFQGTPAAFSVIPGVDTPSITFRPQETATERLQEDTLQLIQELEDTWSVDLVERLGGVAVLTAAGEDYISQVMPDMRALAPAIFQAAQESPDFRERTFGKSYSDSLQDFWSGTPIGDGFQDIADLFGIPLLIVRTGILFGIVAIVGFFALKLTGNQGLALLTAAAVLPLGTVVGLASFTLIAILAMFCVLGLAYYFFFRGASV